MSENKLGCKRCGHCCYYIIHKDEQPTLKKCKHLIRMKSGRTLCRTYKTAMRKRHEKGHLITKYEVDGVVKAVYCAWRYETQFDYEGCPFNDGKHQMFEEYLKGLKVKIPWKD